jgi:hypothetical protein
MTKNQSGNKMQLE